MKAIRTEVRDEDLLREESSLWGRAEMVSINMAPAPLAMVQEKSSFLAQVKGHGKVSNLRVGALHNGRVLAVRLSWEPGEKREVLDDLDVFVDGAAVLFPLRGKPTAITMGSESAPTNAWYWKANREEAYDVLSHGYGDTERRSGSLSGLAVTANYSGGHWNIIFARPMRVGSDGEYSQFSPGKATRIAFAVWAGENAERSGQKSFSGEFAEMMVEK